VEGRRRHGTGGIQRRSIPRSAAGARSELGSRGAQAIARLTKRDAESLLNDFDRDPVAALTIALRVALDQHDANWPTLIAATGFTETRAAALLTAESRALDELAAELNELREVRPFEEPDEPGPTDASGAITNPVS
jgi:hypothetical protein